MKTIPVRQHTVDMRTGRVTAEETVQFGLLLPRAKPGQCSTCFTAHAEGEPHDAMSLPYQYGFYAAHQRWPDWRDAMAHCSPEIITAWTGALKDMGVDVKAGKLRPAAPQGEENC